MNISKDIEFYIEENRHTKIFLKNSCITANEFIAIVYKRYAEISNVSGKIKPIDAKKHNGIKANEFKVYIAQTPVRIAYTLKNNKFTIFYASYNIIKAKFTKDLCKTNLLS